MRELGNEEQAPFGAAADGLRRAEEIRDMSEALFRDALRLFTAHEKHSPRFPEPAYHAISAEGFRAHTKTEVRGAPCGDFSLGIASHGCAIDPDVIEKADACGE